MDQYMVNTYIVHTYIHHHTFPLPPSPQSVSMGELYGEVNPQTFEWHDGLMATIVRECVKVRPYAVHLTHKCSITYILPVQYERRIVEAGFCGGFVAQWFMAALVRHPGFESRSCRFFAFLLSLPAG